MEEYLEMNALFLRFLWRRSSRVAAAKWPSIDQRRTKLSPLEACPADTYGNYAKRSETHRWRTPSFRSYITMTKCHFQ